MQQALEVTVNGSHFHGTYFHSRDGKPALVFYPDPRHPMSDEAMRALIQKACELEHLPNLSKIPPRYDGCVYLPLATT